MNTSFSVGYDIFLRLNTIGVRRALGYYWISTKRFSRLYEGIQTNFRRPSWIQYLDILLMFATCLSANPLPALSYADLLLVLYVFCKLEWENL